MVRLPRTRIAVGGCAALCLLSTGVVQGGQRLPYTIVDTAQDRCYSNTREIPYPRKGAAFYGQDAQYAGNAPAYKDNGDGTVTDRNTGLVWQKTPDLRNKRTFAEAVAGARRFRLAGHTDWRLPTIKELYSLIDFRGYSMRTAQQSVPYINTRFFGFVHGGVNQPGRLIDAQYWSSTGYVGTPENGDELAFGVNFADGRIKGYPRRFRHGGEARQFVRYVRGNPRYGVNQFVDNGDGTISDRATGLVWMKKDSAKPMNWEQALAYAENLRWGGYDDWRLPNAKELQSIVDYTRSPTARKRALRTAATDPVFGTTKTESFFWTSTTHLEHARCAQAVYICFGRAFGYMGPRGRKRKIDVHGAGAQRSDPKTGNPDNWPDGRGPQGDEIRIYNYVRCVRGGKATPRLGPPAGSRSVRTGRAPPSQHAGRRFVGRLDIDGDGKVSRSEFDGPAHHFGRLDRDGDGFLSEDEAPKGPPPGRKPRPRR